VIRALLRNKPLLDSAPGVVAVVPHGYHIDHKPLDHWLKTVYRTCTHNLQGKVYYTKRLFSVSFTATPFFFTEVHINEQRNFRYLFVFIP
jgi:hypothetical protein